MLDDDLSAVNDEIDVTTTADKADFRRWANVVSEQHDALKAMDAPEALLVLHQSKIQLRLLQANWLEALADGRYAYSEDQFQSFVERLAKSRQLTSEAAGECIPHAPST
jgi:hypothetical protein